MVNPALSLPINITISHAPVTACANDTFQFAFQFVTPISGSLTMTVFLHQYEEMKSLNPAMNNLSNRRDSATFILDTLTSFSGTRNYDFIFKVGCNAIPTSSTSLVSYQDSVILRINGAVYPEANWGITNPPAFAPSPALTPNHEIVYQWGVPNLVTQSNDPVSVNFIDIYNSSTTSVIRRIKYLNQGSASHRFNGKIKFSDSISCPLVKIDSIRILVDAVEILPQQAVQSGVFHSNEISCIIPPFGLLIVYETLSFPAYKDSCFTICPDNARRFNCLLEWGCDILDSLPQLPLPPPPLCHNVPGQSNIALGTKKPELVLQRFLPLPAGNAPDFNYWNAGMDGNPVDWKFILKNTGDNVAKNVKIRIWNFFTKSLYYIENDSMNVQINQPHEPISSITRIDSALLGDYFPTIRPSCLSNFQNPLHEKTYTINYLFPSQSVLLEFPTQFCCPMNDVGSNNTINLFNTSKTLNTWKIEIKGYDECGYLIDPDSIITNSVDTLAGLYGVGTNISPNTDVFGENLYLDQEHIPPGSTSLNVPQGQSCSPFVNFELKHLKFNLNKAKFTFELNDANIFSASFHRDPDSMYVSAIVRFKFILEPGLYLDTALSGLKFQSDTTIWPVSIISLGNNNSCDSNYIYYVDFNAQDLIPDNTVSAFYGFMNHSTLRFGFRGCCCHLANTNPKYRIETYISGLDSSCFIPMDTCFGTTFIHCPGCQVPGMIVQSNDSILYRTSLGLADNDNDGLLDFPSVTANSNQININKSIVGDTLKSIVHASISFPGPNGCSIYTLKNTHSISLDKLYLENKIENSRTNRFNVNLISVDLAVTDSLGFKFPSIHVTPASGAVWNKLFIDSRDLLNAANDSIEIIFINLSESVLHSLSPNLAGFTFKEGEKFDLILTYRICGNYSNNFSSLLPADNKFNSDIALNMYLTATNLDSLHIYNAYTDHNSLYPVAVDCNNPTKNLLYNCESTNGSHTFYTVNHHLNIGIGNGYNFSNPNISEPKSKCQKKLVIESEVVIGGGTLYNVFPYEYRAVPQITKYRVNLPPSNQNYTIGHSSGVGLRVRAYNELGCYPFNEHDGSYTTSQLDTTNPVDIIGDTIDLNGINHFIPFTESMFSLYQSPACSSSFTSIPNLLSGDEYLKLTMEFPFTSVNCTYHPDSIYRADTLSVSSVIAYQNFNNCSGGLDTIPINKFINSVNVILPPNVPDSIFTDVLPVDSVFASTTTFCFPYGLTNGYQSTYYLDNAENTFIIIPNPGIFSAITVGTTNLTPIRYVRAAGDTIDAFFFKAGKIDNGVTFDYEFCCTLKNCSTVVALPLYYGWNCNGYPTGTIVRPTDFCYVNTSKSIKLRFDSPTVTTTLTGPVNYQYSLCIADTFTVRLSAFNAGIHNINFNLTFNATDLVVPGQNNIDTGNFVLLYHDSVTQTPITNYTIQPLSPAGYHITINDSAFLGNNIFPGDYISIQFVYIPTVAFNNTPYIPPYTYQFSYSNFCNNTPIQTLAQGPPAWNYTNLNYCTTALNVSIGSSSQTPCSNAPFQLYSSINFPGTGILPYTYSWSTTPAMILSPLPSPVVPRIVSTTTFTLTVTDSLGHTGTANYIINLNTQQCCTPSAFNPTLDYDFTNKRASQLISSAFSPVPQPFTTNRTILINDTFTVDTNFSFVGCHNIILGPGAVIDVLSGDSLILNDCIITSCSVMARGIIAESGSKVKIQGSWIKDCLYGLEARNLSTIKVKSSYFINNFIGIYLSPYGTSGPISINASITNTEFASSGNLKTPYLTLSPAQPTKPFAGIKLSDVSTVTVGNIGAQNLNKFTNLNYGIYAIRSNLTVYNSRFSGIRKYDNFYAPNYILNKTQGSAIFADGRQGAYHLWQYGRNDTALVDFQNCQNGIYSLSSSLESVNNTMVNCDNGYWIVNGQNLSLRIWNNTINFNQRGIASVGNINCSNRVFSENTLTGGLNQYDLFGHLSKPSGIIVNDNGTFIFGGTINKNRITIYPHAGGAVGGKEVISYGISLLNCGSFHISDNEINLMNTSPIKLRGISLQNSNQNFIECNHIVGILPSPISSDNKDISLNLETSAGNTVSCNDMMSTSTGLKLAGVCLTPITPTIIRTNDFGMHYTGLLYTASAVVDSQINMGNQWYQSFYAGWGAKNEDTSSNFLTLEQYIVELGGSLNIPNPISPPNWFFFNSVNDETCDLSFIHHGLCGQTSTGGGLFNQNFARLVQIALDSIQTANYNEETQWQAKVALYEYLINTPQYLDSSVSLADFYTSYAGTNIQHIADINNAGQDLFNNQQTLIKIINDNATFIYYQSRLINSCDSAIQTELYHQLERDSIISRREILNASIQSLINYNNNAFHVLDSTISIRADLINNQNKIINGTNKCEENEQIVNDVYYNTVAINQLDNLFNYAAALLNIALQCPLSGGPAVYKARSLYYIIDPTIDYDDEETCLQSGFLFKNSRNLTAHSKLYPNPSKDVVNIVYNVESNSVLQIFDCYGRIIKYNSIDPLNYIYSFNVEYFENGFYSYRIIDGKGSMIDAGQFIIMK